MINDTFTSPSCTVKWTFMGNKYLKNIKQGWAKHWFANDRQINYLPKPGKKTEVCLPKEYMWLKHSNTLIHLYCSCLVWCGHRTALDLSLSKTTSRTRDCYSCIQSYSFTYTSSLCTLVHETICAFTCNIMIDLLILGRVSLGSIRNTWTSIPSLLLPGAE